MTHLVNAQEYNPAIASQNVPSSPLLSIFQVYSWIQEPIDTCPAPTSLSFDFQENAPPLTPHADPSTDYYLPIVLHKSKHQYILTQYSYPIVNYIAYDHLSSSTRSVIASLLWKLWSPRMTWIYDWRNDYFGNNHTWALVNFYLKEKGQ